MKAIFSLVVNGRTRHVVVEGVRNEEQAVTLGLALGERHGDDVKLVAVHEQLSTFTVNEILTETNLFGAPAPGTAWKFSGYAKEGR